jgi:PAS domain S-box-containing protein
MITLTVDQLHDENEDLRRRLEEAEDALRALRAGEVDAVLIETEREQVYTLEAVEKPYRLLVEQMPRAAATLTADGAIIYCNRRFADLLQRPLRALLGKPLAGFVTAADRPLITALLRDSQTAEVTGEVALQRGDGTPVPAYLGISTVREGALGLCLMVTDLTEQRHYQELQRTQEALRQSEQRYRLLVEGVKDYAIFLLSPDGRVASWNAGAERIKGYRADEIIGQNYSRFFTPEDVRGGRPSNALQVAAAEGRFEDEGWRVRKDGSRFWANVLLTPLRDATGQLVGFSKVTRDITERRLGDERYRSVVNHILDGIIAIDEYGTIQTCNPAAEKLFGYEAGEVLGRNVRMLMPNPYHAEHDAYLANYLRTGVAKIIGIGREVLGRRKDGSTFPMDLAVSEFHLGQRRFFTGIVRDITEHKRLEKELRQRAQDLAEADRRKDEFLATLAHELRSPLAPIHNAVQILKAKGPANPELQWGQDVIDRQVRVMARLLDDLLDVSRVSHGKLELRTERVELTTVLNAALETSRPRIEAASHELTVALPPEPIHILADPVRLAQVFSNLLNNAAKYTEEGGRIWLTVERQESDVIVSVKDNGIGINAEMLPRIFEIFAQAPRALVRSQGGLGIGLSLVKGLVDLHGGNIEAKSGGVGRGSEFVVRLPVAAETPFQEPARLDEAGGQLPVRKRRILIVDDNRDSADSLTMLLQIVGHEVRTAYDGEQAVEAARALRPEIALLDIGMPKLNGYDACRRIREQPWGQGMYLIALTGCGQEQDQRRTEEAGFNHHMVKPVDPAALMKLLASLPSDGGQLTAKWPRKSIDRPSP